MNDLSRGTRLLGDSGSEDVEFKTHPVSPMANLIVPSVQYAE